MRYYYVIFSINWIFPFLSPLRHVHLCECARNHVFCITLGASKVHNDFSVEWCIKVPLSDIVPAEAIIRKTGFYAQSVSTYDLSYQESPFTPHRYFTRPLHAELCISLRTCRIENLIVFTRIMALSRIGCSADLTALFVKTSYAGTNNNEYFRLVC